MSTREALHEFVEQLTDEQVQALWERLREREPDTMLDASRVLDAGHYPVLAKIWDNEDDDIFDQLRACPVPTLTRP
ncbi:MAG TPA: hypothetical protein VN697_05445 [Tepidiformaceae bacterium]|nr:hypothetical protein [Tepidiformaceae bacterium]